MWLCWLVLFLKEPVVFSEALRLLLLWSADIFSSSLYVLLSQSPVPVPTQMAYRPA